MTLQQIETSVDKILEPYDEILNRADISKILGVTYSTVLNVIKEKQIPTFNNTERNVQWKHVKIHKEIMREHLIKEYRKNTDGNN